MVVVLLLHGATFTSRDWEELGIAQRFAEAGHEVSLGDPIFCCDPATYLLSNKYYFNVNYYWVVA